MGFWQELRRRRVYRMVGFYVVGAWLIIQIGDVFFPAWGLPETALRFLIIATMLCFPIALIFSWTFDISTSGSSKRNPLTLAKFLITHSSVAITSSWSPYSRSVLPLCSAVCNKLSRKWTMRWQCAEKIDNSVAVLPFVNLDTNPDTGYFSDGVTEEILHRCPR